MVYSKTTRARWGSREPTGSKEWQDRLDTVAVFWLRAYRLASLAEFFFTLTASVFTAVTCNSRLFIVLKMSGGAQIVPRRFWKVLKPSPSWFVSWISLYWVIFLAISLFHLFSVTNPIDVIKIRMQLDNELGSTNNSKNIFKDRYYRGFVRGAIRIFSEEGFRGLYKG